MEIGKVYHQQFADGDRCYAKPVSKYLNGRFKALTMSYNRKPALNSVDATMAWIETPAAEIPKKMKGAA